MTGCNFLNRACPACGTKAGITEVKSHPPAETLSLEELHPYWSGLFQEKVFFSYDRCASCGMLFAPVYFSPEQLGELYADMAPNMEFVPSDTLAKTQRGYWDVAKRHAPLDGDYLEIGPDIGYVVRHAATQARYGHFWLFEPNLSVHAQLAHATEGKPHTISAQMDDLSAVPDGSVGLATMIHVLDHLLEPKEMLERIRTKLRPDGVLVIVTHNEGSALRRMMSLKWPPFCLQHPELYNPRSMRTLIQRAGFADADVKRSTNYFPISFMARQAAYTVGLKFDRVPLPRRSIGLKLGNIITFAYR